MQGGGVDDKLQGCSPSAHPPLATPTDLWVSILSANPIWKRFAHNASMIAPTSFPLSSDAFPGKR